MLQAYLDGRLFGTPRGGDAPLVVALHGWQRHSDDFEQVLDPVLAAGDPFGGHAIPSIALELPGFGISPPPPAPWGTGEYASLVIELLRELPVPVVLLGHSFGGRVALRIATQAPTLVRGLVLSGVPIRDGSIGAVPRPRLRYRLIRVGAKIGVVSEAKLEHARRRYGSRDYREAEGVMRDVLVATLQDDYRSLLPGISARVELIWGTDDTAAPLRGAEAAAELLPNVHLQVLGGVGHMVPLEAPFALRDALGLWAS